MGSFIFYTLPTGKRELCWQLKPDIHAIHSSKYKRGTSKYAQEKGFFAQKFFASLKLSFVRPLLSKWTHHHRRGVSRVLATARLQGQGTKFSPPTGRSQGHAPTVFIPNDTWQNTTLRQFLWLESRPESLERELMAFPGLRQVPLLHSRSPVQAA